MRRGKVDATDARSGASFSIISIATGLTTLFSYGLATGGPSTSRASRRVRLTIVSGHDQRLDLRLRHDQLRRSVHVRQSVHARLTGQGRNVGALRSDFAHCCSTSAIPNAGGPFVRTGRFATLDAEQYWSAMLASERSAPFMSFVTGWFSASPFVGPG